VKHPARWLALTIAVVLVVLGVVLALNVGTDPQEAALRSRLVGKAAPSFDLPNLAGGKVSTASLAGKSVIVNFWNTWCIPCQNELPTLKKFYAAHKNEPDFVMVGIVRDDSTGRVRTYVNGQKIGWTVALDPDNQAALAFATRGQPETYAIDGSGTVVAAIIGPIGNGDLERFLAAARA